jgi:hypothetical protein
MCRIIWKILHEGVNYEERGLRVNPQAARDRTRKLVFADLAMTSS